MGDDPRCFHGEVGLASLLGLDGVGGGVRIALLTRFQFPPPGLGLLLCFPLLGVVIVGDLFGLGRNVFVTTVLRFQFPPGLLLRDLLLGVVSVGNLLGLELGVVVVVVVRVGGGCSGAASLVGFSSLSRLSRLLMFVAVVVTAWLPL